MKQVLTKSIHGWVPGDPNSNAYFEKQKIGTTIHGEFAKMRNPDFHRKFFALLNLAYDYWEPGEINSEYGTPEKNFDRFRKDLTILSGYYEMIIRLDGSAKPEPKSISFASMDQDEFEKLYNAVLTQIIKRINVLCDKTPGEINEMVDQCLMFA